MGKTITTYLIDGNPQGVRSIFTDNKWEYFTTIL